MADPVLKADVIDAIGELVEALGAFSERLDGRELELILRADGTLSLMGAESGTLPGDGPATGFEEIEDFDSIAELVEFLQFAEVMV